MRKLAVSVFVTMVMFLNLVIVAPQMSRGAAANSFTDVASDHWANETISWAVQNHIVNGYPDGTFRPSQAVKEAEFLAMLYRAYPQIQVPAQKSDEAWYDPYFSLANSYNWPVWYDTEGKDYDRGRVAQVVTASQGEQLGRVDAVQYLLDHNLSQGKTAASVAGYKMEDHLTRAEAVRFIQNMKNMNLTLSKAAQPAADEKVNHIQVRGISIGDSEANVITKLGQPARKDLSEYGFQWYIYNQEYNKYAQIGIQNGKVVGLYTNSDQWSTKEGIKHGSNLASVRKLYGQGLDYILRGNIRYLINASSKQQEPVYQLENSFVTFFIDIHENNTVSSIQVIEQSIETAVRTSNANIEQLQASFERQMLDLVNASRVKFGLPVLSWNSKVAEISRNHSKDMAENNYFDHTDLSGNSPFDRMKAAGISYSSAAENIAAGQTSAIYAHEGLMNSKGHRDNILSASVTELGVGVILEQGTYNAYYTQKFIKPMNSK